MKKVESVRYSLGGHIPEAGVCYMNVIIFPSASRLAIDTLNTVKNFLKIKEGVTMFKFANDLLKQ